MLQTIRDKISGTVAIVFLGAIAIVFVFWGIDFQSGTLTYAAKVDGEKISIEEVRRAWQREQSQLQQTLRDEIPPEVAKARQAALLEQFVRETLLKQRAHDLGYRVSDETLAQRVREYPQFQVDGKFSKDRYIGVLRSAGLTETQFERDLRDGLLIDQLQKGLAESAFVAPYELERRYAIEKQQREIDYALIPSGSFADKVSVTDEQIQKYYEDHKSNFMLPETVDLQYVALDRSQAEGAVDVSEEALRDYYESVKQNYSTQEERKARHILIPAGEGMSDAQAEKLATELTAKAKAGEDFAQLAKANSKDPGSAAQGGDLGWAPRETYVGPFADALFAMNPGEIRGPVKTQFGYHVIKLEDVRPAQVKSFEEARPELEAEYRKEKSQTIFYDQTQKLADTAFSALTELDSVAKQLNLQVQTIKGFTRENGGGELGPDPNVIEAAFSEDVLERGQNSPLVTVGEDRALVLRVSNHKPAEPRPLAEVREQIVAQMRTQAMRDAAVAKGNEVIERLKKGEPWSEVVTSAGLTPAGKRFVTRQDSIAPPAVLESAFNAGRSEFSADKPHYAGVMTADGNYAVLAVTQAVNADPTAEPATELAARRRRVQNTLGMREFSGYLAESERNADIEKNPKVFD
jgi:peptidyl-prolyl cis-trans isomerase D